MQRHFVLLATLSLPSVALAQSQQLPAPPTSTEPAAQAEPRSKPAARLPAGFPRPGCMIPIPPPRCLVNKVSPSEPAVRERPR